MGSIRFSLPASVFVGVAIFLASLLDVSAQEEIRVLNFQADSGFEHESKPEALAMVERLGRKNGWVVETTSAPDFLNDDQLAKYHVVIFNNNCGTDKRIFNDDQHEALQTFIRMGGGFVGIHCAGAIWHEGGKFQKWYEGLIGTRLVAHPHVQQAMLTVDRRDHQCTAHLPREWRIKDEWHTFSYNPRDKVNVLLTLNEDSYEGEKSNKMGGDHPFTWYQYYDGGRSFFTSLGHTKEIYQDANYQRMVEAGIVWASGIMVPNDVPVMNGLILDLNADEGIESNEDGLVTNWRNQVGDFPAQDFSPNDYGIRLADPGSGRPRWLAGDSAINDHRAVQFREDELINMKEDAFDHLITGSGYTWFAVIRPAKTADPSEQTEFGLHRLRDVNAFIGNLRNEGNYEGLWGCFDDDLTFWCGSRSGVTFGRFDTNNPKLSGPKLSPDSYYILAARMGSGTGKVPLGIFVNSATPAQSLKYPVSSATNASRMAIGTERDATNHPGSESFDGSIARILIYERSLRDDEMQRIVQYLSREYAISAE